MRTTARISTTIFNTFNLHSMNINEIRQAIQDDKRVYWKNTNYPVIKDNLGQLLITCTLSTMCIGLTNRIGDRLNGDESDFFTN